MAKKRRKRKSKKNSSIAPKIILLFVLAIIAIFLIDNYTDYKISRHLPQPVQEQLDRFREAIPSSSSPSPSHQTATYENLTIPARLYDREEQIIHHTGYSVSYNETWRIPNWTSYEMTRAKSNGTFPRAKHFKVDPQVLGISAKNEDYANSGYDRGHMVPAGDMKWDKKAMEESFYYSNMCPQNRNLNAGDWKELEDKVRNWAIRDSAIIVITGPIVKSNKPKRIGVNGVVVPDAFYKVILSPYTSSPQAIGFIMQNEKCNNPLRTYAVTVDSIESVTGIDFFPSLPDEIENKVESVFSLAKWGL